MAASDIKKWDQKYRDNTLDSLGSPESELLEYKALLPKRGLALDLACGTGRNTLFLAQLGLDVLAVDGAGEGLKQLERFARDQQLQAKIQCVQADLDDYRLPQSEVDLIVVVRYLDRRLFGAIRAALKGGGILVYKTFNKNMLKRNPGFNEAYTIETSALIAAFSDFEVLKENAGDEEAANAFVILRKPV